MPKHNLLQEMRSNDFFRLFIRRGLPLLLVLFFLRGEIPFWLNINNHQEADTHYRKKLEQELRAMGKDSSYQEFLKSYQDYKLHRDRTITIDTVRVIEYFLHNEYARDALEGHK